MNNINQRIRELVERICDPYCSIWWNKGTATFSSEGCCDGIKIERSEIQAIVDTVLKNNDPPIYVYTCRDDGIVAFENVDGENTLDVDNAFELDHEGTEGLYIGWD